MELQNQRAGKFAALGALAVFWLVGWLVIPMARDRRERKKAISGNGMGMDKPICGVMQKAQLHTYTTSPVVIGGKVDGVANFTAETAASDDS